MAEHQSWQLQEGDPVTDELTAMRLLGGGPAYEAYLAFDEITYSPVVVKVVRPDQVGSESNLRGLRREIDMLQTVNHPGVMRLLRADVDHARPHLVLEHVEGPRLSTLIRRHGPLQPQQYVPLAVDLAAALHYFGHLGVVHLDVKPSNIIMGSPARLIDLSVARPREDAETLTVKVGTDAFMSPEQVRPQDPFAPGPASDVWGLGVTLFEAVSGQRAFPPGPDASGEVDRRPQAWAPVPELPRKVPAMVADVIASCLRRDPADRPSPEQVAEALEPVMAALPRPKLTFKVRV